MAKLSARGRMELARVSRERSICAVVYSERKYEWGAAPIACSLTAGHAGDHSGESLTTWERTERALMSDGKILEKLDCMFSHGRHSYGWKVRAAVKTGVTPETWKAAHTAHGWTETN
jgi:hypothetical protein